MSELNPNHPVTAHMRTEWHKLAALLMHKQGVKEVVISQDDLRSFIGSEHKNIAIQEKSDGLHLYLLDDATAQRLARSEGGLPL